MQIYSQGWNVCYSGSNGLTRVFTLDWGNAYAVGYNGFMLRTTNGGLSWEELSTNTTKDLYDVKFLDTQTGFICGSDGTLLKSIDGGNTWTQCTTNTTLHLKSICFIDDKIAFISGSDRPDPWPYVCGTGIILKTVDGGQSFIPCMSLNAGIQRIAAYNKDTCLAICNGLYLGGPGNLILKTTNGGISWQTCIKCGINLTSIETFPSGSAYVCGYMEELFKTPDFGISWDSVGLHGGFSTDMSFPSPDTGYTVGYDLMAGGGMMWRSIDSGLTWNIEMGGDFFGIDLLNDSIGFTVKSDGTIYKRGLFDAIKNVVSLTEPVIVYPNPVYSYLNIEIQTNASNLNNLYPNLIEIISIKGEKLREEYFFGKDYQMNDLQALSPGLYNLVLKNNSSIIYSGRFVKK